jgi:glycosyltransferase involved in cell wall biosynthesis
VVVLIDIILVKADPIMDHASVRADLMLKSLRKRYSVLALGWDRGEGKPDNTDLLQVFNVSAPYGCTTRYLILLPIFWTWVFIKLCNNKPKIIHACNLDTILPCFLYKMLFKAKLVFDMHDRYAMSYISRKRGFIFNVLYRMVNSLEENIANKADLLIAVYHKIFETFKEKPRNCIEIMVAPEDLRTNSLKRESNIFKVLFTGHVRAARGLDRLLNIMVDIDKTELLIVGRVEDELLLKKIKQNSNSKYLGFLNHYQLVNLEINSDVLIALYDADLQTQHRHGMANKILEAMMCSLPIITNIANEFIKETQCGVLVEYNNDKQIKEAIITLRDNPSVREKLGQNGRKAFEEKYNWPMMEEKLLKSYESLFTHSDIKRP